MAEPEVRDPRRIDEWCSIGPKAVLMTGFFREWLQQHFSDARYVESPELRGQLWTATHAERAAGGLDGSAGVLVESVTRWKPESTENRPAILIRRDDWADVKGGIGDRLQGDLDLTGREHYATFVRGSHTLFCVARLGQEAEILAGEVYREFQQFGPAIRHALNLLSFRAAGCSKIGRLEEAAQTHVVAVTVGYAFEEKWQLITHAPVLRRIVLSKLLP